MAMDLLRSLPSVDALLRDASADALMEEYGRDAVVAATRELLEDLRAAIRDGREPAIAPNALLERIARRLEGTVTTSLRPVINATGVVLHTNLGRAPLASEAERALRATAERYLPVEMDLETGRRGPRGGRLEDHVRAVTGAEAAVVVNNNAAAVLLLLNTLARDREAVVSRGELVEIGGSFRIPDVMAASGARMVEVGTTNRTRPADYEEACGADTGLLLKVHTSNYRVVGFTREVGLEQLVTIGGRHGVPVAVDLGSGVLHQPEGLELEEPTVQEVLATGVDVVTFSGDKALGGPQAGYLVGRREAIEACRSNALMRALRPGRLTLAAAEATWSLCRRARWEELPAWRMLSTPRAALQRRAEAWAEELARTAPALEVEILEGEGRVGGGTAPMESLPTALLAVEAPGLEAGAAADRLRRRDPALVARVREGRLLLDPRTVLPDEDEALLEALASLASEETA